MQKILGGFGRRKFIKNIGLGVATAVFGAKSASASRAHSAKYAKGKAKNLIFLVIDGMCTGTYGLAHHWSLRNQRTPLNWEKVYQYPKLVRALQDTASASSPVTDSAAAASAWGCGQRVMNGAINTDVKGASLKPLYHYAKSAGKATGLVTTCRLTHATPAGFAANVAERAMEDEIARQYLELEIDVLLGGGLKHFQRDGESSENNSTPLELVNEFKIKGYSFLRNKKELAANVNKQKLLGLFSESHIPYVIDRKYDETLAAVPSLPDMFKTALQSLSQSENGFVLQVEAGRVDHAGHVNDPAAILHEFLEFDHCIPIALEFFRKDPDTLLIITTDHGTGGCQLNGWGSAYCDSGPALERINKMTASFESLEFDFRAQGCCDAQRFAAATGITLEASQIEAIQAAVEDKSVKYLAGQMARIVENQLLENTATGWTSNNHTSECVETFALGPGAEFMKPAIKNNELFHVMTQALGFRV